MFQGLHSLNPHQDSAMNPFQSLHHLETSTFGLQPSKTQSLFKKRTLEKLLI